MCLQQKDCPPKWQSSTRRHYCEYHGRENPRQKTQAGSNLELLCFRKQKLPISETPPDKAVSQTKPAEENVGSGKSREKYQVKWGKREPTSQVCLQHLWGTHPHTTSAPGAHRFCWEQQHTADLIPHTAQQRLCQSHRNRLNYVRLNQLIKVASQIYNEGFFFIWAKLALLDYTPIWFETETMPSSPICTGVADEEFSFGSYCNLILWQQISFKIIFTSLPLFSIPASSMGKIVCTLKPTLPFFIISTWIRSLT